MGLDYQIKRLSAFCSEKSLRCDYKHASSFEVSYKEFYSYKDLFDFVSYKKIELAKLDSFQYAEISNVNKLGEVEPITLSFSNRQEENENLFKKIEKGDIIKPISGDVLISKIRPYLNKNILIENGDVYFTKAFIHIRPKINSELFYILLRTIFFNQLNTVSRQGKGYPTLKEDDLKSIRFPKDIIDKTLSLENELLSRIKPLKGEIVQLKNSKVSTIDIINQVFSEEFCFDWQKFENLKAKNVFKLKSSDFSNNIDCRMGIRFHNLAGEYLQFFLSKISNKKIKDFLAEPIALGASVSPIDYDEDGENYYIAMSNIKNWAFDNENCKKVSDVYSQLNQNKVVRKNDILLARSGEGTIGKVALIEDDEINAVFADFTQRIRLDGFDPLCAYYYFRSDFFQYLIHTHKKGLGNNTNIFPSQIQELPMPNWNKEKQSEVVKKIKVELEKQQLIELQIEEKQKEIGNLIELAIKKDPIFDI
ncbi:hypothetical protein [Aggregatibacter actinomycetemcomitans]|uniref:hypothetical protein n=1 Tax=Aggregatibacter actinomycetemcomitans TaxID=714 RepID=UPI00197BF18E|nr:hypothetical protein [Aggregatibacter actinomycetemcomitans]